MSDLVSLCFDEGEEELEQRFAKLFEVSSWETV